MKYDKRLRSIAEVVEEDMGGWVCEQHPDREFPHDDCSGPGMPRYEHLQNLMRREAAQGVLQVRD